MKGNVSIILMPLLIVALFSMHCDQDTNPTPFWAKIYGSTDEDLPTVIRETSDEGFFVAGSSSSFALGGNDIMIMKLARDGKIRWQYIYATGENESPASAVETADEGFVITGTYTSPDTDKNDIFVMMIDKFGNIEWQKTYGNEGVDSADEIIAAPDGGYLVSGYTASIGNFEDDVWLLKLDQTGNIEWQKTYGDLQWEVPGAIIATSDDGYLVACKTDSAGSGADDIWVLKLDADGATEWQKCYGGAGDDYAVSLCETGDGNFLIGGCTASFGAGGTDGLLIMADGEGTVQWSKTYGGAEHDGIAAVAQIPGGGYFIAANTFSFGNGGNDIWVIRINAAGGIQLQNVYGGENAEYPNACVYSSDDCLVIAGPTWSFDSEKSSFLVLRMDLDGTCDLEGVVTAVTAQNPDTTLYMIETTVFPVAITTDKITIRNGAFVRYNINIKPTTIITE